MDCDAVAVLGVLYVHVWSFGCGTVGIRIGPIDINRVLSLLGTGVDLFFVNSGFCMYMMYDSRIVGLSWASYRALIASRRAAFSPPSLRCAVRSTCLAEQLRRVSGGSGYRAPGIHLVSPGNQLATPFWSLATERHFYLVLPLLAIIGRRHGYVPTPCARSLYACAAFRGGLRNDQ
jgi:peptidoglycan/LPS O-acetylase OafA/YrhL